MNTAMMSEASVDNDGRTNVTPKPPSSGLLQELISKNPTAVIPSNVILSDYSAAYNHVRALTSAMTRGNFSEQDVQENLAKVMIGAERGIPMTTSIEALHLVEGRIIAGSWLIQSLAEEDGWTFDWSADDPTKDCTVTATHPEKGDRKFTFTIDMASMMKGKQPGTGFATFKGKPSNWDKTPWAMLYARAVSIVARRCSPRRLLGMYISDEVDDMRVDTTPMPKAGRQPFKTEAMRGPQAAPEAVHPAEAVTTPESDPEPAVPDLTLPPGLTDAIAGPDSWESQVSYVSARAACDLAEAENLLLAFLDERGLARCPEADDAQMRAESLAGHIWLDADEDAPAE